MSVMGGGSQVIKLEYATIQDKGAVEEGGGEIHVLPLGNIEDGLLDVPGSFISNDPVHGKDISLYQLLGLVKVHWNGTIGIELLQKVMCAENSIPCPRSDVGGVRYGAWIQPQLVIS